MDLAPTLGGQPWSKLKNLSSLSSSGPKIQRMRTTTRIDPRPSPAQLAVAALAIWIVGSLIAPLHILVPVGLALLLVAGAGQLIKPRKRTMSWRGRTFELDDAPSTATRVYRAVFRS
jgi:hypothetical protein